MVLRYRSAAQAVLFVAKEGQELEAFQHRYALEWARWGRKEVNDVRDQTVMLPGDMRLQCGPRNRYYVQDFVEVIVLGMTEQRTPSYLEQHLDAVRAAKDKGKHKGKIDNGDVEMDAQASTNAAAIPPTPTPAPQQDAPREPPTTAGYTVPVPLDDEDCAFEEDGAYEAEDDSFYDVGPGLGTRA